MIRKGENYCFVEANIFCHSSEYSIDGNIVVSREIYANGRNSCKINGRLVTVNELKEIMSKIIDIHGQQDNRNLLDSSNHIEYLDSFIGNDIIEIKTKYRELYEKYIEIDKKIKDNYGDEKEKERRLDLLEYQFNEIEKAKLKIGEDEELQEKHNLMKNSEKLQENLNCIDDNLENAVIEGVSDSIRCLEKIESYGEEYSNKLTELKNIYYEIQEVSRDISSMKDDVYFDESDRNVVEERLDEIFSLKRKYGNSIEEIIEYKDKLQEEINTIENADAINEKLKKELFEIEKEMKELSKELNNIRVKFATELSKSINNELHDLEMNNAIFNVKVEKEDKFNKNGLDKVEFMISTNKGEDEKELIKIASGGEMSRIMLAIKTILSDVDKVGTLVFDEIDTGISGKAAKAVGEKMKFISKKHQIICVTHLPAIAAKGDYNYFISKSVKGDKTVTSIKQLSEDETIAEIARIANGDVTEIAIANAKELRNAV